jgi:hypothetical protein
MSLQAFWARLGGAWAFARPSRTARLLLGFARTEQQSEIELRQAAGACGDVRRRAMYLRHALDEARHARVFFEQASQILRAQGQGAAFPRAPSEELFARLGEARFVAFVARGERQGRTEFEIYGRMLRRRGRGELAALFEGLVKDELQHEAYTARLLGELGGAGGARRLMRWAARRHLWSELRRRGRAFSSFVYLASMWLAFWLLTPYALLFKRFSRPRLGFSAEP